jgi:flagellar assembly factor FliW
VCRFRISENIILAFLKSLPGFSEMNSTAFGNSKHTRPFLFSVSATDLSVMEILSAAS